MKERVNIYIDGSNFYHACRTELKRTNVDIEKLVGKLVDDRDHRRTYYYNVKVPSDYSQEARASQQRFFAALDRIPYLEVRLGRSVKRGERWIEKGVDMRLGIDLLSHAVKDLFDTAIIVSGDGDFEHAIRAVKDTGKHVEVACFRSVRSNVLLKVSDIMHELKPPFFDGLYIDDHKE